MLNLGWRSGSFIACIPDSVKADIVPMIALSINKEVRINVFFFNLMKMHSLQLLSEYNSVVLHCF